MKGKIPSYEDRIKWFNDARFGMFIHWGLYSILGRGEWAMLLERIPRDEYVKLSQRFNPFRFNADKWVSLAKEAGMKYIVFTTRHHDGFCLFDSKVSDFTSVKTAAKRDFVAEFVKACKKENMKIGLYYSLLDWRFLGCHKGPEKGKKSFLEMVRQAHLQVEELMMNYGKIDILWYDGWWIPSVDDYEDPPRHKDAARWWCSRELNKMVRLLQPHIIINNRAALEEDFGTPEQHIPPFKINRAWETCMTIGDDCGWGYIKHNPNLKSTTQLIQYLVITASKGGNYLLNVGPKPDGTIQQEFVERLKEIGKWVKTNGESIYGSERLPDSFGNPIRAGIIGTFTTKGNDLYVHVFRWPGETAVIPGIKTRVISAVILKTGKKVTVEQTVDYKVFLKGMPKTPPDRNDTVIKLKLDGKPDGFDYKYIPL